MTKTFFKICKSVISFSLLLCVLINVIGVYFTIGYRYATVASGSMSPEININDVIIIHLNAEYEVGDIISYYDGENIITHRVVNILDDNIITKGDANNVEDRSVSKENVLGKVVAIIPHVGSILNALGSLPAVFVYLISIIAFMLLEDMLGKENGSHE